MNFDALTEPGVVFQRKKIECRLDRVKLMNTKVPEYRCIDVDLHKLGCGSGFWIRIKLRKDPDP